MEYISIGLGLLRLLYDLSPADNAAPLVIEEWVYGRGSYVIHEEISEAQACSKAEARAKLDAIQKFNGEYIASDTFMSCRENNDNIECPMHTFTWSMLDGLISGVRNKTTVATKNLKEERVCKVVLEAKVSTQAEVPDPSFDLEVVLDPAVLREGDTISIAVEPTTKMFLNIFVEDHTHTLTKIFPNRFESNGPVSTKHLIPSTTKYTIRSTYPTGLSGNDTQEVIHVLATTGKVSLLDTYTIETFNLKLLEIPNNQKRYVRKGYRLVR